MSKLVTHTLLPGIIGMLLTGCASLAPQYQQPRAPIASEWPSAPGDVSAAPITWRTLFADEKLRQLVQAALDNNRDLRVAVLQIESARARYRIQRADLFPSVGAGIAGDARRTSAPLSATGAPVTSHTYTAGLDVAWEIDLFGRVGSLNDRALQEYLATDAAARAARVGLVAEVANIYLSLTADTEQLALAKHTLQSRREAHDVQRELASLGGASDLALRQAEAELEAARDQTLALESVVATDRNALELLVGMPLPRELRPDVPLESMLGGQAIPAGLPSDLLQRRPDILAAEHHLIGANANIGAARAAFFPSISLTGGIGAASDSLSSLFDGGTRVWNFMPQIHLPIFSGGALNANLQVAKVERDIALVQYERSIQAAFREVSDALAVRARIDERLTAQQRQVDAARASQALVQQRYESGVSGYLEVLDAQRTLYTAQQNWINTRLARQTNLVSLFKALGGDWLPAEDIQVQLIHPLVGASTAVLN